MSSRQRSGAHASARAAALSLALAVALSGCTTLPPPVAVIPVAAWGGTPTPAPAVAQRITRLTLHHQGEIWREGSDVPAYLRRLQRWSRESRGWADIPYHFVVAPDGRVYAARPVALAGDTNTEYDPRGHLLVMLLGNFEEQTPTPAQWQATVALLAAQATERGLTAADISSHRHESTRTLCPGANLLARFDELRQAVAAHLSEEGALTVH